DLFLGALPAFPAALFSRSHGRVCVDRRIHVYQRALELFLLPHPQSLPCVSARPALQRRRDFSLSRAPAPTRQNRRLVPSPVPPLPFFLRESLGLSHLEIKSRGRSTASLTAGLRLCDCAEGEAAKSRRSRRSPR